MKTSEELLAFSQGNMEAFIKAAQIYATGFQDMSKHFAASSQDLASKNPWPSASPCWA